MKVYRTLLPDWFIDVEAESETAAKEAVVDLITRQAVRDRLIVWEDERPSLGKRDE